ncbi:MAG: hypothetical protein IID44_26835 [Planctomycetes bacterium]|nr:hypothetical protein [Planctomycetota bacterium]
MQYLPLIVAFAVMLVVMTTMFLLVSRRFIRCPSNRLLVICGKTGRNTSAMVIHGGAVFIWPVIQSHCFLSLEPMHATVSPPAGVSQENLGFEVPCSYTFAIGTDNESMQNAAIRLLGLPVEEIEKLAAEIIRTELARLVDATDPQVNTEAFHNALQVAIDEKLRSLGLQLINVGYQS